MSDLQTSAHAKQLRQDRAQERVVERVRARPQRLSWSQERAATLARYRKRMVSSATLIALGLMVLPVVLIMLMESPPLVDFLIGVVVAFAILFVFVMVVLAGIIVVFDTTHSIAQDALDTYQLPRVPLELQGAVPIGALEEVSDEDAARGAVSLSEQTSAGALSVAQDEARQ